MFPKLGQVLQTIIKGMKRLDKNATPPKKNVIKQRTKRYFALKVTQKWPKLPPPLCMNDLVVLLIMHRKLKYGAAFATPQPQIVNREKNENNGQN